MKPPIKPLQSFLDYLRYERQYSEHTLTGYESDLKLFATHIQISFEWDVIQKMEDCLQIKPIHIRSWVGTLTGERTSIFRRLSAVRSFFKFLYKKGYIPNNPSVKIQMQNRSRKLVAFIPETEMNNLLNNYPVSDDYISARNLCILELLYGCGLRRSELAGLQWEMISLTDRLLKIDGKGKKQRLVPLNSVTLQAIEDYIRISDAQGVFIKEGTFFKTNKGGECYSHLIYTVVKEALEALPNLKRKHPHLLRHTYATHLVDAGADLNTVKELLGHAGLQSTEVYVHNSISKLKELHQKFHPRA